MLFEPSPQDAVFEAVMRAVESGRGRDRFFASELGEQMEKAGLVPKGAAEHFGYWLSQSPSTPFVREMLRFLRGELPAPRLPLTAASVRASTFFRDLVVAAIVESEGRTGTNEWAFDVITRRADQTFRTHGEIGRLLRLVGPNLPWMRASAAERRDAALDRLAGAPQALEAFDGQRSQTARPLAECQVGWRVTWLEAWTTPVAIRTGVCVDVERERTGRHITVVVDPHEDVHPVRHHGRTVAGDDPRWRQVLGIERVGFWAGACHDEAYCVEDAATAWTPDREWLLDMFRDLIAKRGPDYFKTARELEQAAEQHLSRDGLGDVVDAALWDVIQADPEGAMRAYLKDSKGTRRADTALLRPLFEAIAAMDDPDQVAELLGRVCWYHVFDNGVRSQNHFAASLGYHSRSRLKALAAATDVKLVGQFALQSTWGGGAEDTSKTSYGDILVGNGGRETVVPAGTTVEAGMVIDPPEDSDWDEDAGDECICGLEGDDEDDEGDGDILAEAS